MAARKNLSRRAAQPEAITWLAALCRRPPAGKSADFAVIAEPTPPAKRLRRFGLALFAALGTEICLQHGTGPVVAIMLGVTTAVTGGMIRDIICNEIPLILSREIYATAAFVTTLVYVIADSLGLNDHLSLLVAVVVGFTIRALAIVHNWSLPSFGMHKNK